MDVSDDEQNIPAEQRAARQAVSIVRHDSDWREGLARVLDQHEQSARRFINDYWGQVPDTDGGDMHTYILVGRANDAYALWENARWGCAGLLPYLDETAFENGTLPLDGFLYHFHKQLPYKKAELFASLERKGYQEETQEHYG